MLAAIREIGLRLGKVKPYDEIEADKVLILNFDERGNFTGAELEEFKREKLPKYLYKKAKGKNPPTLTPTLILNRDKKNKSLGNLEKALNSCREVQRDIPNVNFKEERIEKEIERITAEIPKKEKVLVTIKIDGKYVGEIDSFRDALEKLSSKEGEKSKGMGICSVCLKEKEVSGDISPFKFYTIDKPGYISGGFDKKEAYKNFPLCYECKRYIEEGRRLIEENLKFRLGGMNYYIVPEFAFGDEEAVEEILDILFNSEVRRVKLSERERKVLLSDEDEILEILSEKGDYLTINLLFLESQQSAERILLHIQDIYPSRLDQLFRAKEKVEKYTGIQNFTYATIYKFFSKSDPTKNTADLRKYFLEIVDKTFRGVRIDEKFLIKFLLNRIRSTFSNSDDYYRSEIKDALSVFLFVKLTTGEVDMELKDSKNLEEFLEGLPALDTDLKKGLFLMGALTERLLRVQKNRRGSKPFLKKLKGLKMGETDLKSLLPEVRNKLEEYDSYHSGEDRLFRMASEYLSKAPDKWHRYMNVEEMNFYFALGMGMFDKVANFIYRKEESYEEQA